MSETTEVVTWQDELAKYAQAAVATQRASAGTALTFKSGIMKIGGQPVASNKLSVIVIGSAFENAYYDPSVPYDNDNPRSPICFAFGETDEGMAPHAQSTVKQHDDCTSCPHNQWGSAEKGRGKACKNIQRLALMSASPLNVETVQQGEVAYAKLPVTSNKNYSNYVHLLAGVHKRPPFAVITEIATVPDEKTQFKVTFRHMGNVEESAVGSALLNRSRTSFELLAVPYVSNGDDSAESKVEVKKPAGKKKF